LNEQGSMALVTSNFDWCHFVVQTWRYTPCSKIVIFKGIIQLKTTMSIFLHSVRCVLIFNE
jgi:hypothetical protein